MTQPAESPRPQRQRPFCSASETRRRLSSSTCDPSLARTRSYMRTAQSPPMRHGVHLPHDSHCVVRAAYRLLQFYRSEEHTSELQSHSDLVCRLLLEKKKKILVKTSQNR